MNISQRSLHCFNKLPDSIKTSFFACLTELSGVVSGKKNTYRSTRIARESSESLWARFTLWEGETKQRWTWQRYFTGTRNKLKQYYSIKLFFIFQCHVLHIKLTFAYIISQWKVPHYYFVLNWPQVWGEPYLDHVDVETMVTYCNPSF